MVEDLRAVEKDRLVTDGHERDNRQTVSGRAMSLRTAIDRRFYGAYTDDWSARAYRRFVEQHLSPNAVLLDFGAGRGAQAQHSFRGVVARAAGVDIDHAVLENRQLDEAKVVGLGEPIPYPDDTFDIVISANVLEHVVNPDAVFDEIRRVLRPGGVFVLQTPNKRHYVPTIARLTPHQFHLWVNKRRGVPDRDTFPTLYRANTPETIRRLARRHRLTVERLNTVEGRPEYLRPFVPLYPLGILYERAVNSISLLAPFRVVMLAALRKPID
jgi:SAM-dependent methyltransferase